MSYSAWPGIERPARLKLDRLDAAHVLHNLAALPGNRFEPLKDDRKGQYSIRINDQWRICFEWPDGSPGPDESRHCDPERPARDFRRYGVAPGSFFRNDPTVLAESSEPLRNSVGRRKERKGHQ